MDDGTSVHRKGKDRLLHYVHVHGTTLGLHAFYRAAFMRGVLVYPFLNDRSSMSTVSLRSLYVF